MLTILRLAAYCCLQPLPVPISESADSNATQLVYVRVQAAHIKMVAETLGCDRESTAELIQSTLQAIDHYGDEGLIWELYERLKAVSSHPFYNRSAYEEVFQFCLVPRKKPIPRGEPERFLPCLTC